MGCRVNTAGYVSSCRSCIMLLPFTSSLGNHARQMPKGLLAWLAPGGLLLALRLAAGSSNLLMCGNSLHSSNITHVTACSVSILFGVLMPTSSAAFCVLLSCGLQSLMCVSMCVVWDAVVGCCNVVSFAA